MDTIKRRIEYYQTRDGKIPFEDWFESIRDGQTQIIIDQRLARVRSGNFGNCQSLGDGVYELKVYFGPGYRIYFGLSGKDVVLLLIGGDKSTQKTDIERAKEYWQDHKRGFYEII